MSLRPGTTAERPNGRTRLAVTLSTTDVDRVLAFAAATQCRIERLIAADRLVVSVPADADPEAVARHPIVSRTHERTSGM